MQVSAVGTAYELTGPADAPVVALVHGLGLTHETWAGVAPQLAQNFRILNYDLCGHGQSRLPVETPSLTVLSEQLWHLMDELSIPSAAIVGFSLGGMINRRFAMDHPERVWALGVLNSPHERSPDAQMLVEQQAAETGSDGASAIIDAALERWFTRDFRAENASSVEKVKALILANDPLNYAQHRQVLANGVLELIRPKPPIQIPTLVMTCENDRGSTPAMSIAISREIAGSKTVIVPGLRHLGLLERPEAFAEEIKMFLSDVLLGLNTILHT